MEGNSVTLVAVRDPKSTYTGAFKVDYSLSDGNATAVEDYVDTSGTLFFPSGVNSQSITINTNLAGGITINGTNISIKLLETAEVFYAHLSNAQATDSLYDETVFPYTCIPEYFITDNYPNGRLSVLDPEVKIPVVILDVFQTGTVTTQTQPDPGEPGTPECDFKDVTAEIICETDILKITAVSTVTDDIVKVWDKPTGTLIGVIPVINGVLSLPYSINIKDYYYTDPESGESCLDIVYESCGCCVDKEYCCPCIYRDIDANMDCGCKYNSMSANMNCNISTSAQSVDGFYPLYNSIPEAVLHGDGTYAIYTINSTMYYMPNGGSIVQYLGDHNP